MSVQVAVRVRPFNRRETELKSKLIVDMKDKTTIITNPETGEKKDFTFDFSFWSHDGFDTREDGYMVKRSDRYADQEVVFNSVGTEILKKTYEGYNCCLFAYGQTGAGKSYSMVGYGANKGIVPIMCEDMFKKVLAPDESTTYEVYASMMEIYNEKLQDLLQPLASQPKNGLKIREHNTLGVYVEGLSKYPVYSFQEIEAKIDEGTRNRSVSATLMNATSSRAHTIINIIFKQKQTVNGQNMEKTSHINLIDLAGSEKLGKTGAEGQRMQEGCFINKSLTALGLVIQKLADAASSSKKVVIPYRESVLTRMLQNALGGNSFTLMICAVSPADDNFEENLGTLRYADAAKKIKNKAVVNESDTDRMIRVLREENAKLAKMLAAAGIGGGVDQPINNEQGQEQEVQVEEVAELTEEQQRHKQYLEDQLAANMKYMQDYEDNFQNLLMQERFKSEKKKEEEEKQRGHQLVLLNEDVMMCGKVQYKMDRKISLIGTENAEIVNHIVIGGSFILKNHAKIERRIKQKPQEYEKGKEQKDQEQLDQEQNQLDQEQNELQQNEQGQEINQELKEQLEQKQQDQNDQQQDQNDQQQDQNEQQQNEQEQDQNKQEQKPNQESQNDQEQQKEQDIIQEQQEQQNEQQEQQNEQQEQKEQQNQQQEQQQEQQEQQKQKEQQQEQQDQQDQNEKQEQQEQQDQDEQQNQDEQENRMNQLKEQQEKLRLMKQQEQEILEQQQEQSDEDEEYDDNKEYEYFISPYKELGSIRINGISIFERKQIQSYDRIAFGNRLLFVFLQPGHKFDDFEEDWEFAMQEVEQQRTNEIMGEDNAKIRELEEKLNQEKQEFILNQEKIQEEQEELLKQKELELSQKQHEYDKQQEEIQKQLQQSWLDVICKKEQTEEQKYNELLRDTIQNYINKENELNKMVQELQRKVQFEFQLCGAMNMNIQPSKNIQFKVINNETGCNQIWKLDKLLARYHQIKDIYNEFIKTKQQPLITKDPFTDPATPQILGHVDISTKNLAYGIDFCAIQKIMSNNGDIGIIELKIIRIDQSGQRSIAESMTEKGVYIQDPIQLAYNSLHFKVQIKRIQLLSKDYRNLYVEYELYDEQENKNMVFFFNKRILKLELNLIKIQIKVNFIFTTKKDIIILTLILISYYFYPKEPFNVFGYESSDISQEINNSSPLYKKSLEKKKSLKEQEKFIQNNEYFKKARQSMEQQFKIQN